MTLIQFECLYCKKEFGRYGITNHLRQKHGIAGAKDQKVNGLHQKSQSPSPFHHEYKDLEKKITHTRLD